MIIRWTNKKGYKKNMGERRGGHEGLEEWKNRNQ
jgi:hypothetical protein